MRALLAILAMVVLAGCASTSPSMSAGNDSTSTPTDDLPPATSQPGAVSGGTPLEASGESNLVVFWVNGTTTANAAGFGLDTALGLGIRALDLYVPGNITALVVEVAWSAPQDLDLEVHAPGDAQVQAHWVDCARGETPEGAWCDSEGTIGDPDRPIRLIIPGTELLPYIQSGCQGSEWGDCNVFAVGLRSKDANAMLDWTLAATVVLNGEVPTEPLLT